MNSPKKKNWKRKVAVALAVLMLVENQSITDLATHSAYAQAETIPEATTEQVTPEGEADATVTPGATEGASAGVTPNAAQTDDSNATPARDSNAAPAENPNGVSAEGSNAAPVEGSNVAPVEDANETSQEDEEAETPAALEDEETSTEQQSHGLLGALGGIMRNILGNSETLDRIKGSSIPNGSNPADEYYVPYKNNDTTVTFTVNVTIDYHDNDMERKAR